MLRLHQLDAVDGQLPPGVSETKNWPELEEARRTWWVIFCSDRFVSGSTGWPALINDDDVRAASYSLQIIYICLTEPRYLLFSLRQKKPLRAAWRNRQACWETCCSKAVKSTRHLRGGCSLRTCSIKVQNMFRAICRMSTLQTFAMVHFGHDTL